MTPEKRGHHRPAARAVMLQGTGSHAGKTVLAAGLCRLLARRGSRVAPFKSQNMSLNAHVTADGLEMGWAQVMQAEAAGISPDVDMNPILLKPAGDGRSQVIVRGRAVGDAGARGYASRAASLWPVVESSYARLARDFDVLVIEGAGSPAEPNLMRRDIANMRVARLARAAVLLVGDIDRGGVFASLLGTMMILPPRDRALVRGFLLNKFRGDVSLLAPALADLARRTGRRVLGVLPFLHDLRLPEEDGVALESPRPTSDGEAEIAVLRLPCIANFTDFAPLEGEAGITLRYAEEPRDLVCARLVVVPGSKDTIADLRWLKARGFAPAIRAHLARGGRVLGICGGYQMLGRAVRDPDRVESGGREDGLGLLAVDTVLTRRKTTRRVRVRLGPGVEIDAYEIHMGRTVRAPAVTALWSVDGRPEGSASSDDRIRGTYLHGLFDAGTSRARLIAWLRGSTEPIPAGPDARAVREAAYDRVADALEGALGRSGLRALGF